MSKKRGASRKKRFILSEKARLQNLWFSNSGQLLTLTYDYSPSVVQDTAYKEFIDIAIENFNRLDLARLEYRALAMGTQHKACPPDAAYIKFKYKNPILFSHYFPEHNDQRVCFVESNELFYDTDFYSLSSEEIAENSSVSLLPFAEIKCNTENFIFQRFGIGILFHEINHLFGIRHSHMSEETNGILAVAIPKPDFYEIKQGEFGRFFDLYAYNDFLQVTNYTLISPFSIQHYREHVLQPYRSINKTRIRELFEDYSIQKAVQEDYFYLLEKYAGRPVLCTYQDIAALATAIYHIAPDSLAGKFFNLPNYYFIQGVYRPSTDEIKFIGLINTLYDAERFIYPILAQQQVVLTVPKSTAFVVSLYELLKIVGLRNLPTCAFQEEENALALSKNLSLSADCLLTGQAESSGSFQVPVLLSEGLALTVCSIAVTVTEENNALGNRVLLGKKQAIYFMHDNSYVDLIDVCQAVALPVGKALTCQFANRSLLEDVSLEDCWLQFQEEMSCNLTFIFSNGEAHKACDIQFLFNKTITLEDMNVLPRISDTARFSKAKVGVGYYDVDDPVDANHHRENSFLLSQARQPYVTQPLRVDRLLMQLNYCVTIPLVHGILEGMMEGTACHAYIKSAFKLLPRTALWYFDYFNLTSFSLACYTSLLEGVIKDYFRNKSSKITEKCIHALLFLSITEFEYGFSNLWELTDRIEFWPVLTEKLNQLFLQFLFAPMIKTLGYTLGLKLMSSNLFATARQEEYCTPSMPLSSDNRAAYFRATSTVSSGIAFIKAKAGKLCSFFSVNPMRQENRMFERAETTRLPTHHENFAKIS